LRPHKSKLRRRLYGRTKPGTLLKHHIPLKTDHWDVQVPGFTEIDLVSHSGDSGAGDFCYSLNVTDIHTGWTETRAVLGRGQGGICEALEEIRQALPFPLRGIDSDNGSEFINEHLLRYCRLLDIQFTRGRPYKKDDNAHIEQKNWTHVRRILGYVRCDSPGAGRRSMTSTGTSYGCSRISFCLRSSWPRRSGWVRAYGDVTKRPRPLSSESGLPRRPIRNGWPSWRSSGQGSIRFGFPAASRRSWRGSSDSAVRGVRQGKLR
jgi:hypothetical protein